MSQDPNIRAERAIFHTAIGPRMSGAYPLPNPAGVGIDPPARPDRFDPGSKATAGELQQLLQMIEAEGGFSAGRGAYGSASSSIYTPTPGGGFYGDEDSFDTVNLHSTGDPHLGIDGQKINPGDGSIAVVDQNYDDMQSNPDLVHSDSFEGGYRVSTTVTAPNANGVTLNQSATVKVGNLNVTVNADGSSTIGDGLQTRGLQPGEQLDAGNGTTVTVGNDGAVTVSSDNGNGGHLATRMQPGSGHVDVTVAGDHVDVGGAIVRHADPREYAPPAAPFITSGPEWNPFPSPLPTPFPSPFATTNDPWSQLAYDGGGGW